MSSVGRCRLCGEDVPFLLGNPVELGFHMIDRHSAGSIGQYSIDDANQVYQNADYPESSGLSFDDSESKSDETDDKHKKKTKRKIRKKKRRKAHFDEDDIEEPDEEQEEEEVVEEKELKRNKSKHRKPKKEYVRRTGCDGNRKKDGVCFQEEDEIVQKEGNCGDKNDGICGQRVKVYKERRTCGETKRRPCADAEYPCGSKQRRRSRKRVVRTGLYKTSIEMWTKGSGNVTCPACTKTVKPLIRNHKTKVAYTSVGAACMIGFWPICFLFPFLHQCSVDLYCSNCKQPLGVSSSTSKIKPKTKVHVPNIDTTN